ncbi:cupin-like domain-containing protein [Spirillospora sp. CA-294931]|uniref:cupin-like domain-containing protein n=1 Tax=Spirillospora sp. CA-294931 TaxID=3240042 RepID=UPI003D8B0704
MTRASLWETMRAAGIAVRPVAEGQDEPELRREIIGRGGPRVFRGLAESWPVRAEWTPGRLRRRHGDREVTALVGLPRSGVLFPREQRQYERRMALADFLDLMVSSDAPCYLAYQRSHELLGEAATSVGGLPPPDGHGTDTRLWIGSAGTRSMLHSDLKDNLFCQLHGTKRVTLLPWRASRAAYPFTGNLVNSRIDLAAPDLERFPRLRSAPFQGVLMEPGDVLYIPRGCWHDIRSLTPSVSLNHWFGEPQRTREYLRLLALLGPPYWLSTARDFAVHGLLRREERTRFFFSPPSTGRRLYDALRWRDFSRDNDPST